MPRVLLLIPSANYRAPDFMRAAAALDVEVVVGTDNEPPLAALAPGHMLQVDYRESESGPQQIADFAREHPLDAIVAVDDQGTTLAARASRWLGLSHNSPAAVQATRNKYDLRKRLSTAGIASPPFLLASTRDDPARIAARIPFPCVVKPLSLAGGRGVIRADDAESFAAAFARLAALLTNPAVADECGDTAGRILVEGYIPGVEVSLEGLIDDGHLHVLALFDKPDPLEGPFFEETIYVTPSRLPAEEQHAIAACAEAAAHALGLTAGPIHAEMRINSDGAWPIDIAARTIGGLCSRTLRFGTGMSLEELVLRQAVGAAVPSYQRQGGAAGVMMIPIPAAGTLEAVQGLDEARALPAIEDVTITIPRCRPLVPLPEGGEYLGFIFARAETPEEVEAALRRAHAALEFEITPAKVVNGRERPVGGSPRRR